MHWHLAQLNVGRLRAPIDDPMIAEFKAALDHINAIADRTPGFVWRLQTAEGNATALHPIEDDELVAINMSVWESIEALADYVYRSDHTAYLRRRRDWFERYGRPFLVLWWVPAGHIPSIEEALERLDELEAVGPTQRAFTFAKRFAPPGVEAELTADERDVCPA
jgi:Domain of unknown function (DUF3291)